MKYSILIIQILLTMSLALIFYSCSSTSETISKNEFFEPVEKIVYQKSEAEQKAPPKVIARERYSTQADDGIKDAILEMLRVQNKRLDDVVQQLSLLTNKKVADNSKSTENLENIIANRESASNEIMLEMIRDQNQRINGLFEQVKVLLQNQQNQQGTHSNLITNVNATSPAQSFSTRSVAAPTRLDVSLSYDNAIRFYKRRQYEKAIDAFESLLNRGIEQKLADNCYFWMGVSHFSLKRENKAIGAFRNVLSYAGSDKAEGAYFMIGQCYEQMGAKIFAKIMFEKMLRKYPHGTMKQIAEKKLALLK